MKAWHAGHIALITLVALIASVVISISASKYRSINTMRSELDRLVSLRVKRKRQAQMSANQSKNEWASMELDHDSKLRNLEMQLQSVRDEAAEAMLIIDRSISQSENDSVQRAQLAAQLTNRANEIAGSLSVLHKRVADARAELIAKQIRDDMSDDDDDDGEDGDVGQGEDGNGESAVVADDSEKVNWKQIAGQAIQVALTKEWTIVVNSGHQVFVAKIGTGDWIQKDGLLKHASISTKDVCGVTGGGHIYWAKTPNPEPNKSMGWILKNGALIQTSISDNGFWGGVNGSQAIFIAPSGTDNWKQLPGTSQYLSLDGNRACMVGTNGQIYYADDVQNMTSWTSMGQEVFKVVELSGDNLVAVGANGDVFAGTYKSGGWRKIASDCRHASIVNTTIYAIKTNGDIYMSEVGTNTTDTVTKMVQKNPFIVSSKQKESLEKTIRFLLGKR